MREHIYNRRRREHINKRRRRELIREGVENTQKGKILATFYRGYQGTDFWDFFCVCRGCPTSLPAPWLWLRSVYILNYTLKPIPKPKPNFLACALALIEIGLHIYMRVCGTHTHTHTHTRPAGDQTSLRLLLVMCSHHTHRLRSPGHQTWLRGPRGFVHQGTR